MVQDNTSEESKPSFDRVVKEFGNGSHVTLPREFIGEEVRITPIQEPQDGENTNRQISPPITIEKIESVLTENSRDDFRLMRGEEDNFPRECTYEYKHDIRLTIDVNLAYEADEHPYEERGTIVYFIWEPTDEEIEEYADWTVEEHGAEVIFGLDPSVEDIFDHPICGYMDVYNYEIRWNDSVLRTVQFDNRLLEKGRVYRPHWEKFDSLEDYRSSLQYKLATAINEAPDEDYNQYLEAMELNTTVWGDAKTPIEFDRDEVLKNTEIFHP